MTLVVAKSFDNKREAMQGYYRVGRFGDRYSRVSFKDHPLIDTKALASYKMSAFKFVSAMMKKPIIMKAVTVKEIVVPDKKQPTATITSIPYSSMSRKRTQALLSTVPKDGVK